MPYLEVLDYIKYETPKNAAFLFPVGGVSGQHLRTNTDCPSVRFTVIPFSLSREVLG
jgi:hypothetical protein